MTSVFCIAHYSIIITHVTHSALHDTTQDSGKVLRAKSSYSHLPTGMHNCCVVELWYINAVVHMVMIILYREEDIEGDVISNPTTVVDDPVTEVNNYYDGNVNVNNLL